MGRPILSVKDTGSGIAENEIPIVLASFGQGPIRSNQPNRARALACHRKKA